MYNFADLIEDYGMAKLNTLTKYPSIKTYHEIDRGILKDALTDDKPFPCTELFVTEKVDGTNARILVWNDDYIIGSREELLYRRGDLFGNPSQGIVSVLKPYAERIVSRFSGDTLYVLYGEVYGSNINGAKQYTRQKTASVRFFDVARFSGVEGFMLEDINYLSALREEPPHFLVSKDERNPLLRSLGLEPVPPLCVLDGGSFPTDRVEVYNWMKQFYYTKATLDEEAFDGRAEGMVIRDDLNRCIRKLRFEDYEKTFRKEGIPY